MMNAWVSALAGAIRAGWHAVALVSTLVVACVLVAPSASAQDVEVELVLLADASGSIDDEEILFQRRGYAEAITDPRVLSAIRLSAYQRIAVTYVEWASQFSQQVVVPWTIVDGPESAEAFATALMIPKRRAVGRNAIGAALLKGKEMIEENDIDGWRKVIDFSGDSANNWNGPGIAEARAEVLAAGITINGLPILCRDCGGRPTSADLVRLFEDRIIGGLGAFVIPATSDETFADAVRRKLILEISGLGGAPHVAAR